MASFPCLEGLAVAANSRKLFINELHGLPPSVMSYNCYQFLQQVQENDFIKLLELRKMIAETYLYIERKINDDLHFAVGLSHLWEVLYYKVNEHRLLIAELNVFGVPLALQCAEFLTQLSQTKVLRMLEIRKSIAEVHITQILHQLIFAMMSEEHRTQARETYSPQHKVFTNDDLLTQILIRLPILCIHLFSTVSKQWLRIITSLLFIKTHSQITKVDPPDGLFVNYIKSLFESDFVPLDPRLRSKKSAMDRSFSRGSTKEADNVKILKYCNGLLLYCSLDNSPYYSSAGLRIAFDPTKSPHYKLVDAGRTFCDIDIQIYSSETGKWSLCRDRFNYFSFDHFDSAIYWNDGLHWLETENRQLMHYCLNIEDPDNPNITTIPIPQRGMTFLKSYGYMDPLQILIQMSHLLHLEGKLFEWRGSLFLVCLDDFGSSDFTIYEMMIGCSVWTVRYRVHTDDFMTPLPEGWSIRSNVWSIVLGEREQDSFLVIKLSGKVVQYNLISKTLHEIYDCGSNQLDDNHDDNDDDDDDELLQQFQAEHNVYEFIPSFASV
ncbi:ribonuclease H-like domain-containing protein [Tanacetum coccineum]